VKAQPLASKVSSPAFVTTLVGPAKMHFVRTMESMPAPAGIRLERYFDPIADGVTVEVQDAVVSRHGDVAGFHDPRNEAAARGHGQPRARATRGSVPIAYAIGASGAGLGGCAAG